MLEAGAQSHVGRGYMLEAGVPCLPPALPVAGRCARSGSMATTPRAPVQETARTPCVWPPPHKSDQIRRATPHARTEHKAYWGRREGDPGRGGLQGTRPRAQ
eukprot:1164236-Prorocentrum_minimum.AAC.1